LRTIDASAVPRRAPHDLRGSEGLVVQKNANGDWEPRELMLEGEARTKDP
jgi:serine/threonine-protein kinase